MLPHSSTATHVFVYVPEEAPQLPAANAPGVLVIVTVPAQLSVAVGANACAVANPDTSLHSTVVFKLAADVDHVGAVMSVTVIVCT